MLHNRLGKSHINALSNRLTLIMKFSVHFHKREKACSINRQSGLLKMEGDGDETNGPNCLCRYASNGANPDNYYPNIINQLIVRERRLPTRKTVLVHNPTGQLHDRAYRVGKSCIYYIRGISDEK